jgi:hypothetical protein
MDFFHEFFPDQAVKESLSVHFLKEDTLKDGNYYFLECYCTNPDCHCQAVVIQIERRPTDEERDKFADLLPPVTRLTYSWQKPLSDHNPDLLSDMPRTPEAKALKLFFRKYVESHPDYPKKLHQHYEAMRDKANKQMLWAFPPSIPLPIRKEVHIGRNNPCHCGSGKKYKKCCLQKENG